MQKKYIFVFILFFLFFFQTLPVFAQGAQCDSCGTSITYSNFGSKTKTGGYLCKSCYRQQKEQPQQQTETEQKQEQPQQQIQQQANGMQCDVCRTSITNYSNLGSKTKTGYLCKNCYRQQQEDQQQRIQSKKQWIEQQQSKQKEQQTQQQKQQKEQQKQPQNKVCTRCNKPFEAGKEYYLVHDKPFCFACYETFKERCKTCGYLIPPGEEVRNGSWIVCSSCSKDIITTDSQLKACYAEACAFMKSYFGLNVHVSADRIYFSDMSNSDLDGDVGRFFGKKTLRVQNGIKKIESLNLESNFIKVQKGMSKFDTIETLVHEAGHACMHQFGYQKKSSRMYEEGFAEWCAYKYVMSIGKTWHSTKKRDYVEGLRKMLELEKKMKDEHGLLEYVKTHNDFTKE